MALPWWEYAFLSDDSPVSWLSSALLLANAAVALGLAVSKSLTPRLAYPLSAALAMLAIDEQFLFHEQIKDAVGTGPLGDVATWCVGAGGILVVLAVIRTTKAAAARGLVAAAVGIGVFALWVDLGTPPALIGSFEEAFEVLAEGVFLCGLLEIARGHVQSAS